MVILLESQGWNFYAVWTYVLVNGVTIGYFWDGERVEMENIKCKRHFIDLSEEN